MKEDYPYRFKTESEFLTEFGENWRSNVDRLWNSSGRMDHLFGQPYPFFIKSDDGWLNEFDNWSISWDMLTENKPLVPTYEKRIITREL